MTVNILNNTSKDEARTFYLHVFYSCIDGIATGALVLNEFIFIKSLKGSTYQLAFLFQFSMVVFLFAMLANEIMRRMTNRKTFLRVTGIVTRLPLIAFALFPTVGEYGLSQTYHFIFLGIFLIFYTSKIAITPSINQYLRGNYKHENFGKLFGFATSASKICVMLSTLTAGLLLDYDPNSFRFFYPLVGILGVISVYQLTKIPFHQSPIKDAPPLWHSLGNSFRRIFNILKFNKPFRHLEMGFILYGFAWMSTHAVITIFYEKALNLNYSSVAFYNNVFNLIAIFLLPIFGKIISNKDPRRFALITFGALMCFIIFTGLTQYFPAHTEIFGLKIYYSLLIAVLFNGIFMGSMTILWSIGSSYFCKSNEAADYQSVHLFLTGSRALVAPIIGIQLYEWQGFTVTFGVGVIFLLSSMALMVYSESRFPKAKVYG